jgi:hypothetical protein
MDGATLAHVGGRHLLSDISHCFLGVTMPQSHNVALLPDSLQTDKTTLYEAISAGMHSGG